MNSVSIKVALTGLFLLMTLMIGGLGFVAVTKISAINANVEEFANDWLPSVESASDFAEFIGRVRIQESQHILSPDAEGMAAAESRLAEIKDRLEKDAAEFQKLINSEAERQAYKTFQGKWNDYLTLHSKLMELSRARQREQAAALYMGEMNTRFEEISEAIDRVIEINREGGKQEAIHAANQFASTHWQTFLVVGLGLALALGATAFSFFGISRPIERITASMSTLATGDLTVRIPFGGRQNEIGAMAGAVQVFKDNMIHARELEAEAAAVKARIEAERRRAMIEMADHFERAVGGIVLTVSNAAVELQAAAQALSSASSQTTHQSTMVAAASEEAAANVRTVAAAAEELSGSVREISRQVSASADIARKAVREAEHTNTQVNGLSIGARKIGAIVDLINDIASKTNLLALNATIEAARAGDAGRGFAVVAQEVKSLAEQTGKATAEITSHIGSVQTSTGEAAAAILGIGKTIDEINNIAASIAAAVEEQGAATDEIARNVDQAAHGTVEVTRNIGGVNEAAEASSASAGQVLCAATELASQSEHLSSEMQKFLATVRAA
jgi:methyl-accepting chemotaxis protein